MNFISNLLFVVAAALSITVLMSKPVAGKKILVAFDGSGQSAELMQPGEDSNTNFSNILKLHLLAGGSIDPKKTKDNIKNQISLYERGVGAFSKNKILRKINEHILGFLSVQIRPMRTRLQETYEEGDQIYVIGFSRGASSARAFSVELNNKGLHLASGKQVKNVPIEFLGCFDTVSMQTGTWFVKNFGNLISMIKQIRQLRKLGIQSSSVLGEKDGQIPPNVKRAVHALSLDDIRAGFFSPIFMDSTDKRVEEVWFPGDHSDVGGSWWKDGLANGCGKFMKQFLEQADLEFLAPTDIDEESVQIPNAPDYKFNVRDVSLEPNALDDCHKTSKFENRHRPVLAVSKNDAIENGTVRIHESVLDRLLADPLPEEYFVPTKKKSPYQVNPNLAKVNTVVVGDLNEEIPAKTEKLKEALQGVKA